MRYVSGGAILVFMGTGHNTKEAPMTTKKAHELVPGDVIDTSAGWKRVWNVTADGESVRVAMERHGNTSRLRLTHCWVAVDTTFDVVREEVAR